MKSMKEMADTAEIDGWPLSDRLIKLLSTLSPHTADSLRDAIRRQHNRGPTQASLDYSHALSRVDIHVDIQWVERLDALVCSKERLTIADIKARLAAFVYEELPETSWQDVFDDLRSETVELLPEHWAMLEQHINARTVWEPEERHKAPDKNGRNRGRYRLTMLDELARSIHAVRVSQAVIRVRSGERRAGRRAVDKRVFHAVAENMLQLEFQNDARRKRKHLRHVVANLLDHRPDFLRILSGIMANEVDVDYSGVQFRHFY